MTEPDPTYHATIPGAVVKPEPPCLPEWFQAYQAERRRHLMEQRRAVLTWLRAIEAELGIARTGK